MKDQSHLPDIFGKLSSTVSKKESAKYTIHYPKPDLFYFAERESKALEWSNKNKAILNRLTSKRYPINYLAEMERAILSQRSKPLSDKDPLPDIASPTQKRKILYSPLKSIKQIEHTVKFDKGIKNEEIDRMLIQKPVVIYYKRIKSH